MAGIRFRGVSKTFATSTAPAIHDLDLDVADGELVVFVGPSGCGKTTTLRLINRLLEPTSGAIEVGGRDNASIPVDELRRDIGYVIQQVGLFPHRTIAQNIATVPRLLGWSKADASERVDELVDLVGLDRDLLARYPAELSGGQQQRVGVARALAARPAVLLMDEPYSAVDPVVRQHLQTELAALHDRVGTTIVLVTHDIDEAVLLGDRVAVFATGGRLAQFATPDELMARPADEYVATFLGTNRQLRRLSLRRLGDLPLEIATPDVEAGLGDGSVLAVDSSATGRDAVDEMLAHGVTTIAVTQGDDVLGTISLAHLSELLRS